MVDSTVETFEPMEVFDATLDTHPYRLAMHVYQVAWKLAPEKGFDTAPHGSLGLPGHRLLTRIQQNMHARKVLPEHYIDGVLNAPTRKLLIPPITFGEAVAHWQLGEVGVHEVPWGSNTGPRVSYYQSFTGDYHDAWCASFRSAALRVNGYKGTVSARAWAFDDIGMRVSTLDKSIGAAMVGDAVTFNIGDGHIGTYLSHTSSMVKTVDGNTSDAVAIRERPLSLIRCITRQGR